MKVLAVAKGVRISPRKVGVVASLVRGRSVADALVILEHVPRRAAIDVRKTIQSAAANATNNHNVKGDNLHIVEISVTPGPRLKRYRPASHGRALPFQRKTSHIRVVVEGDARAPKKAEADKKPAAKKEAK
jgi:large subunit ribosomal protein L22